MATEKRKGARSIQLIPPKVLQQLNEGSIATVNLVEWLAINQQLLLQNILTQNKKQKYLAAVTTAIATLPKQTVNTIAQTIGSTLLQQCTQHNDAAFLHLLSTHNSDMVRCWAAFTIGCNTKLSLQQQLVQIQPFAADEHFGVREIAWLALRPTIAADVNKSIALLSKWTLHKDAGIRRFASEATRPRGVWCAHIEILKQQPALALPILEPLKADPEKYVQDSVGNWLNDASKSQPKFVTALCNKWKKESKTNATAYIIKKALRTIEKE
jgi:3-methyladenine DNA glycosylase AlkC